MSELRLHANENPWGPSPAAGLAASRALLSRYPEEPGLLERILASKLGVSGDQLVLGNGSTELISLILLALTAPSDSVATCASSFIAYRTLTRAAGRRLQLAAPSSAGGYDLDALLSVVDASTRLILIANPDNPSGALCSRRDLDAFLDALPTPRPLVVLDEAYREYVRHPDYPSPTAMLRPGVLVLRTFSKAYGLAGLRCGYAVADPSVSATLRTTGGPFRVGCTTRAAALAALLDQAHLSEVVEQTLIERRWLREQLWSLGLMAPLSHTNFVMTTLSARTIEALRQQHIRVQPLHDYGYPDSARITVGQRADNQRLINALRASLQTWKTPRC